MTSSPEMPPERIEPQGPMRVGEAPRRDYANAVPRRQTGRHETEDEPRRGKSLLFAALLIGLAVAGAAGWHLLTEPNSSSARLSPPTIEADAQPYRVRPGDPGGMQVPDQDKLVYGRIDPSEAEPGTGVEKLLPEAPQPRIPSVVQDVAVPPPAANPKETAVAETAVLPPPSSVAGERSAVPPPLSPPPLSPPTVISPPSKVPSPPILTPPPVVVPPPVPAAVGKAGGPYTIQLGALREEAAVRKSWESLQAKYPELLGGLTLQIERADLKEKGVFYRLRATGLADEKAARNVCDELSKKNVGCMFVGK